MRTRNSTAAISGYDSDSNIVDSDVVKYQRQLEKTLDEFNKEQLKKQLKIKIRR